MKKVSFFRERSFQVSLLDKGVTLQEKACQVVAGFSASVDPLSGMTVNLMQVEQWFDQIERDFAESTFDHLCEFHQKVEAWLLTQIPSGVTLERIEIKYNLGQEKISGLENNLYYEITTEDQYKGEPAEKTLTYKVTNSQRAEIASQPEKVSYFFKKSGVKLSGSSSENL